MFASCLVSAALADDPCEALRSSFVAIDEALKVDKSISTKYSGTTAVVCLCLQDSDGGGLVIHTANAGDSRAVLLSSGQRCYTAIDLSEDQKPDGAVERERIVGAGGHVRTQASHSAPGFTPCAPPAALPELHCLGWLGPSIRHPAAGLGRACLPALGEAVYSLSRRAFVASPSPSPSSPSGALRAPSRAAHACRHALGAA